MMVETVVKYAPICWFMPIGLMVLYSIWMPWSGSRIARAGLVLMAVATVAALAAVLIGAWLGDAEKIFMALRNTVIVPVLALIAAAALVGLGDVARQLLAARSLSHDAAARRDITTRLVTFAGMVALMIVISLGIGEGAGGVTLTGIKSSNWLTGLVILLAVAGTLGQRPARETNR